MADGTTSLNSINWGTSTGGAAGSAESTLTLGVARTDSRIPPDTSHVWGAQINGLVNLGIAQSQTFKGGTRLGILTQSSSPFGANEQGFWVDNSGNPKFSYGGVAVTLATSSSGSTLTTSYAAGAAAADQTLLIQSGDGGPVIFKGNGAATGALVKAQTSGAVDLMSISDNATNTFKSGVTMSGSAVAMSHDTVNAFTTGDIAQEWKGAGSQQCFIGFPASTTIPELRGTGANIGMRNSSGTGFVAQGANDAYVYGANTANWHFLANNYLEPNGDNSLGLGNNTNRITCAFAYWHDVKRGANLASGGTITPTSALHHVTGTSAVGTIATTNLPTGFSGQLVLIPDGIFTWTSAGNIAIAGTAVVSKALIMTWDATSAKWYPSYLS